MRKGVQFVTRCEEIGHRENVVCFTHICSKQVTMGIWDCQRII